MSTVIFQTENAVFKFALKVVKKHLIVPELEYNHDEVFKLLDFICTDSDETILNPDDHDYFGFVVLDLISDGMGETTCRICEKNFDAGQLRKITVGHGRSPFDLKQNRKGGIRLFGKRKNPSMFGGKGYECPAGHTLISMITWRT